MKNFISFSTRPVNAVLALFLAILVSSCSQEPQRLLFSNHPTEFKRVEKATAPLATPEAAPITASTTEELAVFLSPEQAKQAELTAEISRNEAVKAALKNATATTPKATFREKAATLKAVKKEIKTAKKEIKKLKDSKKIAEGPVTNDVAIKVIILGLIVALLGLIVPILGGLGGLIVIVGLVLLLLNYL
ncbi:hypothetical protein [Adhaeribacter pallidiroseus]|uniref:Uncharacterized protein n=1 Tax=Adhaeribacter pallidiroseus TaxID=2072847 RepID=A0A369QPW9_9BACT|nr:hypothetical protein [Adhaeribacter pallidiroseus]RDC65715.1 hypothetical protein AHMF7616_04345 [Adhaeribacter pallidiroseus]